LAAGGPAAAVGTASEAVGVFATGAAFALDAAGAVFAVAAAVSLTVSLHAVVFGPFWPGGAPPGSGTQALGFDGSVSLTPGWLGPSHA
jgi:hypothetical protein